ncbi:MAG: membrane protein insertase YidC [Flavobacteriales bacterium]|nr:MAG: membrane protein insertase YidC [Flavobacteriales bacterium]
MSAKGFDKNSIIGLVLIGAIMFVFSYINNPSEEDIRAQKEQEAKQEQIDTQQKDELSAAIVNPDTLTETIIDSAIINNLDSANNSKLLAEYGSFAKAAVGEKKELILENEKIKVTLSNKGGRVTTVQLKEFQTYDSLPLFLFHEDSSRFNIELSTNNGLGGTRVVNTENLYFETEDRDVKVEGESSNSISMKLYYGSKDKYLEYKYTLKGNSYLVDFELNSVGFDDVISKDFPYYAHWSIFAPNQEKTIPNQQQKSTIYYKYNNGDIDYIFETKYEGDELISPVDWIMFKQQYFNSTIIATEKPFEKGAASEGKGQFDIETIELPEGQTTNYVQGMSTYLTIPYDGGNNESFAMQYYFGPNRSQNLEAVGIGLEETLDYGWGIFGWVNTILIRPVFDFLNGFNISIGIIILLLTLIIKSVLFPITWKTYLSSAKMKVLKPEIEALKKKNGNDKMKQQQATMALYRQTGVNPLAGCIPMLIQMPILFALFRFFPATFDLRQKSFLWAEDLSTYDSIYDFPGGFDIPFYGDHISLFTLMMAVSMIFYTKSNSQMTSGMGGDAGGAMAAQMKMMTYLMPIMMLFFFNSYAAGLSLYYLIANLITIGQQYAIKKWIVDEDKLMAKIQANKTKKKKKSGFAAKLEKRMKEAQTLQEKRKKK